jgi:hypothetical protein
MGRLAQQFKTRISLEAAGKLDTKNAELWKEAYVDIEPLTVKALPELSTMGVSKEQGQLNSDQLSSILPLLKKSFVGGQVVIDGQLVEAQADDLEDLPLEVTNGIISAAMGQPDPKS